MAYRRYRLTGAALFGLLCAALLALLPSPGRAFGDDGAFHPRVLLVGDAQPDPVRSSAPARWSWELMSRTSAPARLAPGTVRADANSLLAEPFAYWFGARDVGVFSPRELETLRRFFALGGVLFVDDSDPSSGAFGRSTRRELARILPDVKPVAVGRENVLFRSFYLLSRAVGRFAGPETLDAILRHGQAQVVFSSHDVAGALAQGPGGRAAFDAVPDGERQREMAIRLAVNVAMYVLCSNYKDDQVHAPFLMRRRARGIR
ncbi:MAG: DUF4159 domain-containing protein [Polyangiaceae bacterium]|nr:DUF4159 domain-containing protein [Polyangiaceae bacterium]